MSLFIYVMYCSLTILSMYEYLYIINMTQMSIDHTYN